MIRRTHFHIRALVPLAVISAAVPLIQACSLFESEDSGGVSAADAAALDAAADRVEQRRISASEVQEQGD